MQAVAKAKLAHKSSNREFGLCVRFPDACHAAAHCGGHVLEDHVIVLQEFAAVLAGFQGA